MIQPCNDEAGIFIAGLLHRLHHCIPVWSFHLLLARSRSRDQWRSGIGKVSRALLFDPLLGALRSDSLFGLAW